MENLINNISAATIQSFFRSKSDDFKPLKEDCSHYLKPNESEFIDDLTLVGEIPFKNDANEIIIISGKWKTELTEKSSKLKQYKIAKDVIKDKRKEASIFIFYDEKGNFRFSLITAQYDKNKREFTTYKRYTYFVSPDLTNKTFKDRIGKCSFESVKIILEAFSVDKVTKEFYKEIAHWYFWAIKNTQFPKDAEKEANGRNNSVIRLITRMIFIWFMKQRHLVPNNLFEINFIKETLTDTSSKSSTYYKAILQNLFFATLNTKTVERKFRFQNSFQGKNQDYFDQSVYRYEEYFVDKNDMLKIFKEIPFLNGGLFDCLDRRFIENDKNIEIRIDGFSDKELGLNVPNFLFFSNEVELDLNEDFGTQNKKYSTEGLINILQSYNFTIDENDPSDVEVALDPELLGKVFENLLASFNPETSTTARKATGSYYTPREIVDYMVSQSLKEYFKTHTTEIENFNEKLEKLFCVNNESKKLNPFNKTETKKLVNLIDNVRIIDPAVGSGAFPMGILNKLVFLLSKLDPQNEIWKETQKNAVEKNITDPALRKKLILQIEEAFKDKNFNYGRKLYLIQNCIYGVDIQQIAVEIAKLRFFISLLVDEKIDKTKDNWGIEPLPNLEFKLMQGNSLISEFMGINFDEENPNKIDSLFGDESENLIAEFQDKKNAFQNENNRKTKEKLKSEIEELIIKIFDERLKKEKTEYFNELNDIKEKSKTLPNENSRKAYLELMTEKLNKKQKFNLEEIEKQLREFSSGTKAKPFFLWKLYYAEVFTPSTNSLLKGEMSEGQRGQNSTGGFDIVIGNPPYGYRDVLTKSEKEYFRKIEHIDFKSGDSAELFSIKSFTNLVRNKGLLTFIIPKKSLYGDAWNGFRKEFWYKYDLKFLLDVSKAFDNVLLEQNTFGLKKSLANSNIQLGFLDKNDKIKIFGSTVKKDIFLKNGTVQIYKELYHFLYNKILNESKKDLYIEGELGLAIGTNYFSNKKTNHKLLKGIDIERWRIKQFRYLKNADKIKENELVRLLKKKVVCQVLVAHIENPFPHLKITAAFDNEGIVITNTLTTFKINNKISEKFLIGYLNSTLINWFAYNFIYSRAIRTMHLYNFYIKQIPIPKISEKEQQPFIKLVEEIITKKEQNKDTTYLEKQIDQMVYKLYGLTEEEIKLVENS